LPKRLAQHIGDARRFRVAFQGGIAIPAGKNHWNVWASRANACRQFESRDARHRLIGDHRVEALRIPVERLPCRFARNETDRFVTELRKHFFAERNKRLLVIDEQHRLSVAMRQRRFALANRYGHRVDHRQIDLEVCALTETTILRFRHLLEAHGIAAQILAVVNEILIDNGLMLKAGSAVDATLIAAPSSTKNGSGTRDSEMHQTQKGRNSYFGMKAHVGVDAESGLVHTVIGTAANVHDITAAQALLHGKETDVYADAGYQGIEKRDQAGSARWHVAMRPSKRRKLDLKDPVDAIFDEIERLKAGIRAKVEHPFRILKPQFGYVKTRYRGRAKNTAPITTLFALGNLWMVRKTLRKA
jgi:IS5 family transposase